MLLLAAGGVTDDACMWPGAEALADLLCVSLLMVRVGVWGEAPAALWLREILHSSSRHSDRVVMFQ